MSLLVVTSSLRPRTRKGLARLVKNGDQISAILTFFGEGETDFNGIPVYDVDGFPNENNRIAIGELVDRIVQEWHSSIHTTGSLPLPAFARFIEVPLRTRLIELFKFFLAIQKVTIKEKPNGIVLLDLRTDLADHVIVFSSLPIRRMKDLKPAFDRAMWREKIIPIYNLFLKLYNPISRFVNVTLRKKKSVALVGGFEKTGSVFYELLRRNYHLVMVNDLLPQWNKLLLRSEEIILRPNSNRFKLDFQCPEFSEKFFDRDIGRSIAQIIRSFLMLYARYEQMWNDLERKFPMHFVLLTCDPLRHAGLAQSFAVKKNIPSAIFQHGVFGRANTVHLYEADNIYVWGNPAREFLEGAKLEKDRIKIVGCPGFDSSRYETDRKSGRNFKFPSILLALSWIERQRIIDYAYNIDLVKRVFEAVMPLPDRRLILKLHPRQNIHEIPLLEEFVNENHQISIAKRGSSATLLKECSVCLTYNSSVGVDAILMGCLMIKTDMVQMRSRNHAYYNGGHIMTAETSKELEQILRVYLSDRKKYIEALDRQFRFYTSYFACDGKAAASKFCNEIESRV